MNKLIISTLLGLQLMVPAIALADNVTFDPSTPDGRKAAYAALNQSNAVGNANRLLRTLKSFQNSSDAKLKAHAERLIPELTSLIQDLGGTVGQPTYQKRSQ